MANPADSGDEGADDSILTAYLDGELAGAERTALEKRFLEEPALKVRLDQLGRGGRAFGPAYDALLAAAPADRLQAMLAEVGAAHAKTRRSPRGGWNSLAAIAAALVIFVVGGLAGYVAPTFLHPAGDQVGWRQVVAEYQGLTTAETLAAIPDDPVAVSQELKLIGGKLALDLSPDKLALPDAALKRADLFEFRGKPLVQLAYLAPAAGPIAFCIIANGRPDAGLAFEQREGFNIVYWTDGGRGYMLIGKAPRAALETYAGDLAARV
ncbi:MAG: anti-sigma factor [Bauldia sp.]